jgi:hypothetical protein
MSRAPVLSSCLTRALCPSVACQNEPSGARSCIYSKPLQSLVRRRAMLYFHRHTGGFVGGWLLSDVLATGLAIGSLKGSARGSA